MTNVSSWFDAETAARLAKIQRNFKENQLFMEAEWPRLLREHAGDWAAVWARRCFIAASLENLKAQLDCPGWIMRSSLRASAGRGSSGKIL